MKKPMSKPVKYVVLAVVLAALAFLYYYVELPAFNIHAPSFWGFIFLVAIVLALRRCCARQSETAWSRILRATARSKPDCW